MRRMQSFARHLADQGHVVYVITGFPNYPTGIVYPEYRGKWFLREVIDGVTVVRTIYYMVPRNISKLRQLLSYLSILPAYAYGSLRVPEVDVVFVTSPPLFNVLSALFVTWWKRAKMVLDLRDLWPDEFVAFGAASDRSLFVRMVRVIERWGYRYASRVTCTTRSFMDTVATRGAAPEKLVFVPNGADVGVFTPKPRNNPIADECGFGDKFVVMYSGLMGIKFGLELLIEAAERLRQEKDIVFYIRGAGPRRQALMDMVAAAKMENVRFGEEREFDDIPYLLARADVCVSCLLPDAYLEKIVSVKVFEYLSCGRPVVAAVGGETARVIEESGGGIVVPPGDASAMAEAIRKLRDDPERREEMSQAGRRYICENYSRDVLAGRMEQVFLEVGGAAADPHTVS